MGQGGGYDFGIALSGSSSATSGLEGNFSKIFGDKFVGGLGLPKWALPVAIVVGGLLLLTWILRR